MMNNIHFLEIKVIVLIKVPTQTSVRGYCFTIVGRGRKPGQSNQAFRITLRTANASWRAKKAATS